MIWNTKKEQFSFTFDEGKKAISISVKNFKLNVKSVIYHKFLFFSNTSGTFDSKFNLNIDFTLGLSTNKNNQLQLILSSLDFNYKGSNITYQGGFFEWLTKTTLNTFESLTEMVLRTVLKSTIGNMLDTINSKFGTEIEIPKTNSTIAISVNDKILIDSNHLDLSVKLKFTHKNLPKASDNSLAKINDVSQELKIFANHDLVNSFLKAIFLANNFKINITSDDIKPEIPFKMNTRFFEYIITGLYDKYPDQEMILEANLEKEPQIFFDKENQTIQLSSNGVFNFALRSDPNKIILSLKSLFYLELKLGADQDAKVHILLNSFSLKEIQIVQSEFPDLDVKFLQKNINYLFTVVCNAANEFFLAKGIQIPIIYGLKFQNFALLIEDDFLSITLQPDLNKTSINWLKLF